MLLGEPPPTQADLHFRLFSVPVRVHPFFWLGTLILGTGSGPVDPVDMLVWVVVVFFSILVHEMGHATTQTAYGGHPWITLYGLGGLASCNDCDRSPLKQIIISLAGPAAGFMLAAIVVLGLQLSGHKFGFLLPGRGLDLDSMGVDVLLTHRLGPVGFFFEPVNSKLGNEVIGDLLFANIVWGILNLLPVYPLDGGQVARELFTLFNPRAGIIQSLQLSAGVAVLLAAYSILNQRIYTALLFGYLAYSSFQTLQAYRNHWR
jgi:stage IV sporulation protein FB